MGWKNTKAPFSHEYLLRHLHYDPLTGQLLWRTGDRRGLRAGYYMPSGYTRVKIGGSGQRYLGHVIAWFYMTGEWPQHMVDHENNDKTDLRWENLRAASWTQNRVNSKCRKDNRSGYKGVHKSGNKWLALICFNKKLTCLGRFNTPEEAHAAYVTAAHSLHGVYARDR